jgi:hypothetical protein
MKLRKNLIVPALIVLVIIVGFLISSQNQLPANETKQTDWQTYVNTY